MKRCLPMGFLSFVLISSISLAQTLYVPSGTVGTSSYGNVGIGGDEAGKAFAITAADTSNQIGGSLAGIHIVNSNASAANRVTEITFGGRTRHHKPFAAVSGVLVADQAYEQSGSLVFSTKSTTTATYPLERMRIRYDGNVGIGSASPSEKLSVSGGDLLVSNSMHLGSSDNARYNDATGTGGITLSAPGDYGNGTTFQLSKSASTGWSNMYLNIIDPNSDYTVAGSRFVNFYYDGASHWALRGDSAGHFYINREGGAGHLAIPHGNVGIGTTTPSHKLAVNGTIRAKEVIVDTDWADYVFADDYDLASLSEVEAHIEEKGHLPDIPSATDVAVHGVSLGEMQSLLLAKIEELTLHTISQQKQLEEQRSLVETQAAQIRRLLRFNGLNSEKTP